MTTVIYGHPHDKSFNHAILETVCGRLKAKNEAFSLIDLYADNFDPAVRKADLALYSAGGTADPLARKYMEILKDTDRLIFIYPVWWGVEPAIVKGFYDKVFLRDFAWVYSEDGSLLPRLDIGQALLFTTSEAPGDFFSAYFTDYLPAHVFAAVGIRNSVWRNMENVASAGDDARAAFLRQAEQAV